MDLAVSFHNLLQGSYHDLQSQVFSGYKNDIKKETKRTTNEVSGNILTCSAFYIAKNVKNDKHYKINTIRIGVSKETNTALKIIATVLMEPSNSLLSSAFAVPMA